MEILVGELKIIEQSKNRAVFEISPLYAGYGVTLGNSLRRVLLSSMEGAAAVKVKIDGVPHEFTTVDGVLEDIVDIILNLKKIRFKLSGVDSIKVVLNAKGEKEVRAGDLKAPTGVEVVNPDQIIATITDKKAELNMEIEVDRGIGYLPVEQRQKDKLSVGEIAIDAIFNPVRKVSFRVENIRVGERTDFNKLFINIETDGSITPQEALKRAVAILMEQFRAVGENGTLEIEEKVSDETAEAPKKKRGRPKKVKLVE
ncbi:MAG: DNA-directed RNA polymerase subunit alpha [Parcubacteria group bacterium RIFCSPLOWO2_01_FULL_40_65]|nr:MAG: DNA-directed RNA polymerase subunit alpha [Parcubacteria group bacterium RIFCSPHIGHO2_01_FULL_40_30]OHB19160.1 MAG: DNA-directed RNA polymerase subunit alpha [Parcubacteria group bacterium RIFCSPHIGHO2_02_FULL_40_12]OHB21320.1 MAG: DNA-directed RNA polymerase subunit alpha [Parcubacteria group bacterium RIFCSPLOWO2_01_FULL_40_65]OHB23187.1 MAG: DNA-directed RNA polymerase subunit alpha [Parcubacteria group bacterium RIFCSPLOWO2_02_FULL_40_12]OHB23780.1 MAG: DNA-directed RNA polymerase s